MPKGKLQEKSDTQAWRFTFGIPDNKLLIVEGPAMDANVHVSGALSALQLFSFACLMYIVNLIIFNSEVNAPHWT